jgi:hypothetical protein
VLQSQEGLGAGQPYTLIKNFSNLADFWNGTNELLLPSEVIALAGNIWRNFAKRLWNIQRRYMRQVSEDVQ